MSDPIHTQPGESYVQDPHNRRIVVRKERKPVGRTKANNWGHPKTKGLRSVAVKLRVSPEKAEEILRREVPKEELRDMQGYLRITEKGYQEFFTKVYDGSIEPWWERTVLPEVEKKVGLSLPVLPEDGPVMKEGLAVALPVTEKPAPVQEKPEPFVATTIAEVPLEGRIVQVCPNPRVIFVKVEGAVEKCFVRGPGKVVVGAPVKVTSGPGLLREAYVTPAPKSAAIREVTTWT